MFPSNNLFSHITCPYFEVGLCERPRCNFKHSIKKVIETTLISKDFKDPIRTEKSADSSSKTELKNVVKNVPENIIIKNTSKDVNIINLQISPDKTKTTPFLKDNQNAKKSKKRLNSCLTNNLPEPDNVVEIVKDIKNSKQICLSDKNDALKKIPPVSQVIIKDEKDEECFRLFKKAKTNDSNHEKNKSLPTISTIGSRPIVTNIHHNLLGNNKVRIAHAKAQVTNDKKENLTTAVAAVEEKLFAEIDNNSKISQNIRQSFIDKIFIECKKIMKSDEAKIYVMSEEKLLRSKCSSNRIYLTRACNFINNIRKNKAAAIIKNVNSSLKDNLKTLTEIYKSLEQYFLTKSQLDMLGFPQRCSTDLSKIQIKNNYAKYTMNNSANTDLKICCRCSKVFSVNDYLLASKCDTCIYHSGSSWKKKINGSIEYIYNCCQGDINSKGCQSCNFHVYDDNKWCDLTGYHETFEKMASDKTQAIYALDCEMVYTTGGFELARVTVVDHELQTVIDKLVCPSNKIVDYNTKFSGITKELMEGVETSFNDIQTSLLYKFNSQTILIGHSLESDLISLKLVHNRIIDTSITFPHHIGLPFKRSLKNIAAEFLHKIIQDDVRGHDSKEDAATCMELMLWKIKDSKKKKVPTATLR